MAETHSVPHGRRNGMAVAGSLGMESIHRVRGVLQAKFTRAPARSEGRRWCRARVQTNPRGGKLAFVGLATTTWQYFLFSLPQLRHHGGIRSKRVYHVSIFARQHSQSFCPCCSGFGNRNQYLPKLVCSDTTV